MHARASAFAFDFALVFALGFGSAFGSPFAIALTRGKNTMTCVIHVSVYDRYVMSVGTFEVLVVIVLLIWLVFVVFEYFMSKWYSITRTPAAKPEPWIGNLGERADKNTEFRDIVWTGNSLQVTTMRLKPKGEIGNEVHTNADQLLTVYQGRGEIEFTPSSKNKVAKRPPQAIEPGTSVLIPAGQWHRVVNSNASDMTVVSVYSYPQHAAYPTHTPTSQSSGSTASGSAASASSSIPKAAPTPSSV
jgi:mannose-6-phosphate isomerase-like protein (cupin superfamily)